MEFHDSEASNVTKITVGASLNPDSASSGATIDFGRGIALNTENTAAASVDDTTAPRISDARRSKSSKK